MVTRIVLQVAQRNALAHIHRSRRSGKECAPRVTFKDMAPVPLYKLPADTLKKIKSAGASSSAGAGPSAGPPALDVFNDKDTLALDGSTPTPPSLPPRKKAKKGKVVSLRAD